MAESVVSFAVQKLGDLLIEEVKFLHGVDSQFGQIRDELRWMRGFLKDIDANQNMDEIVRLWIHDVKELAYDAEDVIETFLLKRRRGGGIVKFLKRCGTHHNIGLQIQDIQSRISSLTIRLQIYGARALTEGQQGSSVSRLERERELRRSYSHFPIQEDFVIELDNDIKKLVDHLVNENEGRGVVSIYGMGGLGKTTLARKIYKDIQVKRHFDCSAWTCISQQWQTKTVWKSILTDLDPQKRKDIRDMDEYELVRELNNIITNKKCLIVIDDIWSTEAWDCLKPALRIGKKGSKILLTTRIKVVAEHADREGFLHEPRKLTDDESWKLLKKKTHVNEEESSSEYQKKKELGRKMLTRCGGLPLAILVLGGMLMAKTTSEEWEKVCASIEGRGIGQHQDIEKVLALSYFDLPYQLKPCFNYLSTFPEDSKIEVEKLCHLLIAEGLILSRDRVGDETMTEIAERYLHELAQRSMISLQEGVYDIAYFRHKSKCCCLHDLMRDLSLSKAKEQNLFEVFGNVAKNDDAELERSFPSRRQVIACGNNESEQQDGGSIELKKRVRTRDLRSLIVHDLDGEFQFRKWTKVLEVGRINSHLGKLKLLRVLVLEGIDFENTSLSNEGIGKLIHLRYLSLRGSYVKIIPSSIGNLEQLQTLDLRTIVFRCFVPRNLLRKMGQLRHLYLPNFMVTLFGGGLRLDCKNLETFKNFVDTKFNVKNLFECTNLRTLSAEVRKDPKYFIDRLTSDSNGSITLNRLQHLELDVKYDFKSEQDDLDLLQKLVSIHCLEKLTIKGIICKLPEHHHFSLSVSRLMLERCELEEDPMKTLEKLPNLTFLLLHENAFVGKEMTCSAEGFPKLKHLAINKLNKLEKWIVEEGAMPSLHFLRIDTCIRLKEIPDALRFAKDLEMWVDGKKSRDIVNVEKAYSHGK